MDIYINGKKIRLSPKKAIGKGGEADVYDIGKQKAVKVFKQPSHPDYIGLPLEQKAAEERLKQHQTKLKQFPHNLPSEVITPQELVTDKSGYDIVGYTMPLLKGTTPLLKYSDRNFRTQSGIDNQTVTQIFGNLHQTIIQIHQNQVVIGDFNDLNILINQKQAYLIDADSFQYGGFLCQVYTARFVDHLLCKQNETQLIPEQPHNSNSDWYAFTVMLMQSLLFVHPYGGVYKPKKPEDRIPHSARPLKRITVFDSEVKYPKPALAYSILSDDLLHHFHNCFKSDKRGEFPRKLLDNLHWQKCDRCGVEHARITCPNCSGIGIQIIPPPTVTVRGKVTLTHIFRTEGVILATALEKDHLYWLYYDKGSFKREDNQTLFTGELDQKTSFRLKNEATLIGRDGQVITLNGDENSLSRIATDSYQNLPLFDCNEDARYWIANGQLLRDGKLGSEYIGDVLENQTRFWVGNHFGFGFYSAGNLKVAFVFDAHRKGINDQFKLPSWQGQIIDTACYFSDDLCWFFLAIQQQSKIIHRVIVIQPDGQILAVTEAQKANNSWLSNIHGHFAAHDFLLVATDEGIVRVEIDNEQITKTKEFPDTESFVDTNCKLFASAKGLYVVSNQEIKLLQII